MRLVILYGSQTGTAQDVAEQIWRESKCWGFEGPVLPMDEFPLEKLIEEQHVVFVAATTGNGDEPDNMRSLWKILLRRSLPPHLFQHLKYACLGLGDSSYAKFNFAAKKLNKRLQQLGAEAVMPLGLCDDQHDHGLSAVALTWIEQLWKALDKRLSFITEELNHSTKAVFKWKLEVLTQPESLTDDDRLRWPFKEKCQQFVLLQNERTTAADHFQDVRLIRFAFPANVTWCPGDVLQLRPCNSPSQVAEFFALVAEHRLDFTAETVVQLSNAYAEDMPLPIAYDHPVNIQQMVQYVWDLSARPRQRVFELLALNCEDELEKEKLVELASSAGLDDLINYINRPRRTILEVLQDFRHATARLTLPTIFELFPIIQARSFSIASIPAASGSVDLLVAVVEYKTKLSKPRLGLCSNWLKSMPVQSRVLGVIKPGTMSLPSGMRTPIIMVGPGTGIAPFRSIIQWRIQQRKLEGTEGGELIVFFGCRNEKKDFHFEIDFKNWQASNCIEFHAAFSRDQEEKVYVQHLIRKNVSKIQDLIRRSNAVILVAGSSKNMPKAVKEAFIEILDNDEEYVEQMIKTKRYQVETWS